MTESEIRGYATAKGFHRQTLERWLAWEAADRESLQEIAGSLKIGENHLRDIMDWLEDIALRDSTKIHAILTRPSVVSIKTDPRLGRADKIKRIKEQLRRWRLPRLAALEESIRTKIQTLKLPAVIRLSVPPGLEGGRLQVQFSAGSAVELEKLTHQLNVAASSALTAEIFDLMSGEVAAGSREET
jgi:hypothetical protein